MGFSTIGSFIIMFFTIMIMISSAIFIYTSLIESTNAASAMQEERINNALNTDIEILSIVHEPGTSPDTQAAYVINKGKRKLQLELLDIYIDGTKIPRSTSNRIITFINNTNIINPLHWDPDEIIEINVSIDLAAANHVAVVATEYAVTDSKQFTTT